MNYWSCRKASSCFSLGLARDALLYREQVGYLRFQRPEFWFWLFFHFSFKVVSQTHLSHLLLVRLLFHSLRKSCHCEAWSDCHMLCAKLAQILNPVCFARSSKLPCPWWYKCHYHRFYSSNFAGCLTLFKFSKLGCWWFDLKVELATQICSVELLCGCSLKLSSLIKQSFQEMCRN